MSNARTDNFKVCDTLEIVHSRRELILLFGVWAGWRDASKPSRWQWNESIDSIFNGLRPSCVRASFVLLEDSWHSGARMKVESIEYGSRSYSKFPVSLCIDAAFHLRTSRSNSTKTIRKLLHNTHCTYILSSWSVEVSVSISFLTLEDRPKIVRN